MSYPTNPNQPPFHGQEINGYRFDAATNQWYPIHPDATIAGKQPNPSKKVLVVAAIGACLVAAGLGVVANLAASDSGSDTTTTSVAAAPLSKDDQFLAALENEINVVPHTTDANLVRSATLICNGFEDGLSRSTMAREIYQGNDVSQSQATQWVDIASRIFCPEYGN